jgi:hypothetical protein
MYLYQNLMTPTSIRLITLQPGAEDDELHCTLIDANLRSSSVYEAVSYVWGDETNKEKIICDGQEIEITKNLAALLRQFRPTKTSTGPRTLWIDSICINQQDIPERNHQVRLMCEIYRKAQTVLVWLGNKDDGEDTAKAWECMDILLERVWPRRKELDAFSSKSSQNIDDYIQMRKELGPTFKTSFKTNIEEINSTFHIPPVESAEFESLQKLLQRPWFSRAWTFQESYVAKKRIFHCGHFIIQGQQLVNVFATLQKLRSSTRESQYLDYTKWKGSRMLEGEGFFRSKPAHYYSTFLDLLSLRRTSGCKDKRDLVFAIIGVAKDNYGVEADYSLSNTFDRVCTNFAMRQITSERNLGILRYVSSPQPLGLPSWVPDWRMKLDTRTFTSSTHRRYNSTGSSIAEVSSSPNNEELVLAGLELDQVLEVSSTSENGNLLWIKERLELDDTAPYRYTNETADTVLARTRCADMTLYDPENSDARWDSTSIGKVNYLGDIERGGQYMAFLISMIEMNLQSRLFVTQNGRLGMAPNAVQAGDIISLILGAEVPILLRPNRATKYMFIGECYVHGFMDGEGLVEIRLKQDPDYDGKDRGWINGLHEDPSLLRTQRFVIK